MREMKFTVGVVLVLLIGAVLAVPETDPKKHKDHHDPMHEDHYEDGEHNPEYDHEAVLGDKDLENEFDDLPPEEAKRRLGILVKDHDLDKNGRITKTEMMEWLKASFKNLDHNEAIERMKDFDEDKKGYITFADIVKAEHGESVESIEKMRQNPDVDGNKDTVQSVDDDKEKFEAADRNKDGFLNQEEFAAYLHPHDYDYMHPIEIKCSMRDIDKDGDGKVSKKEFSGETGVDDKDFKEDESFKEYDLNHDGFLDGNEVKQWLMQTTEQTAADEAKHLFEMADEDKDGELSTDEIVNKHEEFVGSQATDFGKHLHSITDEL